MIENYQFLAFLVDLPEEVEDRLGEVDKDLIPYNGSEADHRTPHTSRWCRRDEKRILTIGGGEYKSGGPCQQNSESRGLACSGTQANWGSLGD